MTRNESRIRKERGGVVSLTLDPVEAAVLRDAFADLMYLLGDRAAPGGPTAVLEIDGVVDPFGEMEGTPGTPPADPALARLLPDAYADDPGASAEFRRFTERDLVAAKQANIKALVATLDQAGLDGTPAGEPRRIRLDGAALDAWLYALNDLRLALGSRLEISDGYEEQVAAMELDDPRLPHFALYEWLTGLQDALVRTRL